MRFSTIPEQYCPHCGVGGKKPMAMALRLEYEGRPPEPRDVAVCIKCAKASVFNHRLILRPPNKEEAYQILHNQLILDAQMALAWRGSIF